MNQFKRNRCKHADPYRLLQIMIHNSHSTSSNLRDNVANNPLFLVFSFSSTGIKRKLKAPGSDRNRDLSNSNVRI